MFKQYAKQFSFYFLSGGTATLLDIGLYVLLRYLHVWYVTASVVSGIAGFLAAFLLHKYFVFSLSHADFGKHFVRYMLLGAWNLTAHTVILVLLVENLHISDQPAKIAANGSVVLWNFFAYKFFVYV